MPYIYFRVIVRVARRLIEYMESSWKTLMIGEPYRRIVFNALYWQTLFWRLSLNTLKASSVVTSKHRRNGHERVSRIALSANKTVCLSIHLHRRLCTLSLTSKSNPSKYVTFNRQHLSPDCRVLREQLLLVSIPVFPFSKCKWEFPFPREWGNSFPQDTTWLSLFNKW